MIDDDVGELAWVGRRVRFALGEICLGSHNFTKQSHTTMDSSSGRLEELAVKRKETKTPKSPMVCGGRYITIDKMRNTPPSIWAKGQPSKSK
jgi:hypothetical protein